MARAPPLFADNGDAPRQEITKLLTSFLCTAFLEKSEHAVDHNDDENCESELWHAG